MVYSDAIPTLPLDKFSSTLKINAHEKYKVACTDITDANLHALMNESVFMQITGEEMDIWCPSTERPYLSGLTRHYREVSSQHDCGANFSFILIEIGLNLFPMIMCSKYNHR